jgi:hypothetical protein
MNTQYSSLDEVWGSSFPKKSHTMGSKTQHPEQKRDAEKEGRVFPTPVHRSAHALSTHKKTIDDLSTSLPIVDHEDDSNYAPARVPSREHFTSTKKGYSQPYFPTDLGADFPYAPPSFQADAYEIKLNKILSMIEQGKVGYETPATQDMLLYIVTGIFFLFTFDTFVSLGKRLR